jgi:hypothetical protein
LQACLKGAVARRLPALHPLNEKKEKALPSP